MSAGQVVPDRTRALLLLAGSRYDVYAPGPKNSRTFAHGKAAPTKKELCKLCDGERVLRDKFGREQPCESCGGRGYHKVDPMLNSDASTWEAQAQTSAGTRRALCDRCAGAGVWKGERCGMCDGAGKVSVPIKRAVLSKSDAEVDVALNEWERMLDRREKAGSYREYDKCIAELHRRSPHRHRIFHEVHVVRVKSQGLLSGTEADMLAQAVRDLLLWMPREIVVPREIVQADERVQKQPKGRKVPPKMLAARDQEIVARYEAGGKTAEIAAEFGLSAAQVQRVLNKAAA